MSADNKLLLGVGNEGSIIELDQNHVFSRLAKTASEQVTGFARATNGKVYVATSNPGKVFCSGRTSSLRAAYAPPHAPRGGQLCAPYGPAPRPPTHPAG